MEIDWYNEGKKGTKEFKIDLIVWKYCVPAFFKLDKPSLK